MKPLVLIESPYAGEVEAHLKYLYNALTDSIRRGEAPFASHGFYTYFLNDLDPEERALGVELGYRWMSVVSKVVFYTDLGWSPGMIAALQRADDYGPPLQVVLRALTLRKPILPPLASEREFVKE